MIDSDAAGLRVCCTTAAFGALQHAEEAEFLPAPEPSPPGFPYAGTGTPIMLQWPYYTAARQLHMHERVPLGDIEIRRGERLHATDATVGKVEGLIVDQANTQVSHILLQQGHLWGARQITIPINAVAHIDGRVHVSLTSIKSTRSPRSNSRSASPRPKRIDHRTDRQDELEWDPTVDASHLDVTASDGAIVLSGIVPNYATRWESVRAAERVYGVRAVADEIEIKLPSSEKRKDSDIAERIAEQFR